MNASLTDSHIKVSVLLPLREALSVSSFEDREWSHQQYKFQSINQSTSDHPHHHHSPLLSSRLVRRSSSLFLQLLLESVVLWGRHSMMAAGYAALEHRACQRRGGIWSVMHSHRGSGSVGDCLEGLQCHVWYTLWLPIDSLPSHLRFAKKWWNYDRIIY